MSIGSLIASIISGIMAIVTAWMACETRKMATNAKTNVDLTKREIEFSKGLNRVRLLKEVLEVFENIVLKRSLAYENAAKAEKMPPNYGGPTGVGQLPGDPFHHMGFLTSEDSPETLSRLRAGSDKPRRDSLAHSPLDVANGIEQFAAVVESAIANHVWDEEQLRRIAMPTAKAFVSVVNEYYDVICKVHTESPALYSATLSLYMRWEPQVVEEDIRALQHLMQSPHDMQRRFGHYRWGMGRTFRYCGQKKQQDRDEEPAQPVSCSITVPLCEGQERFPFWIQATDPNGTGISGFPVDVRPRHATIDKAVIGCEVSGADDELLTPKPKDGYRRFFGNASGTVMLELTFTDTGGASEFQEAIDLINPMELV